MERDGREVRMGIISYGLTHIYATLSTKSSQSRHAIHAWSTSGALKGRRGEGREGEKGEKGRRERWSKDWGACRSWQYMLMYLESFWPCISSKSWYSIKSIHARGTLSD